MTTDCSLPLLLLQCAATCAMLGVIWFVQLVTYPQFAEIPASHFTAYHVNYSTRISWLVGPLMLIELGTSFACLYCLWNSPLRVLAIGGLVLVILIWIVTAVVQVPQHGRLTSGYDAETIRSLVLGNWIRVALWTARAVIVLWTLAKLKPVLFEKY